MAMLGPISGRLSDRYGWRKFTVTGLILSTTGITILSQATAESSLFQVIPGLMLTSSGMGTFYSPNSSSILSAVERESHGVVSALVNLIRNAGNVVSVAVATAIVTATMGSMGYEPSLDAVRHGAASGVGTAFTVGMRYAFFTMIGALSVALFLSALPTHREDQAVPASTRPEPALRPAASPAQED